MNSSLKCYCGGGGGSGVGPSTVCSFMCSKWVGSSSGLAAPRWRKLRHAPHQSTVPPASASIFMNSCVICSLDRFAPRCGPSFSQNSWMSSSPLPSSSASCARGRPPPVSGAPCAARARAGYRRYTHLEDLLEQLELVQVDFIVHAACVCGEEVGVCSACGTKAEPLPAAHLCHRACRHAWRAHGGNGHPARWWGPLTWPYS